MSPQGFPLGRDFADFDFRSLVAVAIGVLLV
jgi:hypothetical protein